MIYVILGQTAVGKTNLALKVAKKYSLPIISADAFQCYKELNIGTGKPSKEEIGNLDYFFYDKYSIANKKTVYDFQSECRNILDKYYNKTDIVVVGGTNLYIKALLFDYRFPNEDHEMQKTLENKSIDELKEILLSINPNTYNKIDINNPRRLIRAIINSKYGNNTLNKDKLLYESEFYCISIDKKLGNDLIDERVDKMISCGLIDECKKLLSNYPNLVDPLNCIGYNEIITALKKGENIDSTIIDQIKIHTHQYAKRQRTFIKNQFKDVIYGNYDKIENIITNKLRKV